VKTGHGGDHRLWRGLRRRRSGSGVPPPAHANPTAKWSSWGLRGTETMGVAKPRINPVVAAVALREGVLVAAQLAAADAPEGDIVGAPAVAAPDPLVSGIVAVAHQGSAVQRNAVQRNHARGPNPLGSCNQGLGYAPVRPSSALARWLSNWCSSICIFEERLLPPLCCTAEGGKPQTNLGRRR
jgi:hypothetical protein